MDQMKMEDINIISDGQKQYSNQNMEGIFIDERQNLELDASTNSNGGDSYSPKDDDTNDYKYRESSKDGDDGMDKLKRGDQIGEERIETKSSADNDDDVGLSIADNSNSNSTIVRLTNSTSSISSSLKHGGARKRSAVMIIAVAPYNKERLMALWSQLECFHNPAAGMNTYEELIISAPLWAQKYNVLELLVQEAMENIPHFRVKNGTDFSISISIHYHSNDRYDVGLWCDALHSISTYTYGNSNKQVLDSHEDFVLVNDSIMAVERNFTSILDVLREKQLAMTSLNYSHLSSPKNNTNNTSYDGNIIDDDSETIGNMTNTSKAYWLESTMRGFSDYGMKTFANHACVPLTHERWCPLSHDMFKNMSTWERKRCIVENFEIGIVDLFSGVKGGGSSLDDEGRTVWGLFSSDVPEEMIKDQLLQNSPTWVNHYNYWLHILRWKHHFPVMKISNNMFLNKVRNKAFAGRVGPVFKTCTQYLDPSFLEKMEEIVKKYGRSKGVLHHGRDSGKVTK